ncbi:MAG: cytochrome c3 family protein [bacterium]|nr:cytochrome c3 family protein [bacterium]
MTYEMDGHGKHQMPCTDCHTDHLMEPWDYKYLRPIYDPLVQWTHIYTDPFLDPFVSMLDQRAYCSYACHANPDLLIGTHPVADDPVSRWPEKPFVNFESPTSSILPGDDMPLLDFDLNGYQSSADVVMCVSCHNVHGKQGVPYMLRALEPIDYPYIEPLCVRCHSYE